jgi:hypothetical protein
MKGAALASNVPRKSEDEVERDFEGNPRVDYIGCPYQWSDDEDYEDCDWGSQWGGDWEQDENGYWKENKSSAQPFQADGKQVKEDNSLALASAADEANTEDKNGLKSSTDKGSDEKRENAVGSMYYQIGSGLEEIRKEVVLASTVPEKSDEKCKKDPPKGKDEGEDGKRGLLEETELGAVK